MDVDVSNAQPAKGFPSPACIGPGWEQPAIDRDSPGKFSEQISDTRLGQTGVLSLDWSCSVLIAVLSNRPLNKLAKILSEDQAFGRFGNVRGDDFAQLSAEGS